MQVDWMKKKFEDKGAGISEQELACKVIIDRLHTDHPTRGARQMVFQLKIRGLI